MQVRDIPISEIISNGDYDDLTNLCKSVQDDMDKARWIIGDAALSVNKRYGKDAIGEFAKDIQVFKSTVESYRRVAAYWTPESREFVDTHFAVNWSILRIAMRFKDIEDSLDFLNRCANDKNITTADDYARQANEDLGKETKPKKLTRINIQCTRNEDGKLTFHADNIEWTEDIQKIELGQMYTVDVYPLNT